MYPLGVDTPDLHWSAALFGKGCLVCNASTQIICALHGMEGYSTAAIVERLDINVDLCVEATVYFTHLLPSLR
jgi:hypothetical protein